jgi:hypothetical protein
MLLAQRSSATHLVFRLYDLYGFSWAIYSGNAMSIHIESSFNCKPVFVVRIRGLSTNRRDSQHFSCCKSLPVRCIGFLSDGSGRWRWSLWVQSYGTTSLVLLHACLITCTFASSKVGCRSPVVSCPQSLWLFFRTVPSVAPFPVVKFSAMFW